MTGSEPGDVAEPGASAPGPAASSGRDDAEPPPDAATDRRATERRFALALTDVGGLVFELHRSGAVNDPLVIEKLNEAMTAAAAAEAAAPTPPDAAWCSACGAALRPHQGWCTQCGARAVDPVTAPARRPRRRRVATAAAIVAAAAAGAGVAVAAGALEGDPAPVTVTASAAAAPTQTGSTAPPATTPTAATAPRTTGTGATTASTAPTTPTTTTPTTTTPTTPADTVPSAPPAADVPVWPAARTGFTVIAFAGGRGAAEARARALAADGLEAGVVEGAAHQGLADGLWMTYVGRYASDTEATNAANRFRAAGGRGYAQEIAPEN